MRGAQEADGACRALMAAACGRKRKRSKVDSTDEEQQSGAVTHTADDLRNLIRPRVQWAAYCYAYGGGAFAA